MESRQERPSYWAKRKGLLVKPGPRALQQVERWSASYKIADRLYRWSDHDYHYQQDLFVLQEDDFDDAMLAASMFPTVAPHEAAITPYARSLRAKKDKK